MTKEPNKKAIGLFLIIGFALFLWLIGQSVFSKINADKKDVYVMYFHESLQGLSEGSSVVFRGVEVGKVTRIRLVADAQDIKFQIPVYVRLKPVTSMKESSVWEKLWKKNDLLDTLIKRGLRARLTTQSYLTGQLMIELVMLPDTPVNTTTEENIEHYPQIPTVLSKNEEFSKGLDDLRLQEVVTQINHVAEVLGNQLPVLLPALTKSAQNLDATLSNIANSSDDTIANLNRTLQDISDAAKSLQNLADYLERHPEALIKGKKGD